MDLNGKNVVYVGGCGGIGSATCKVLVQKNIANLVILDVAENVKLMEQLESLNPSAKVTFLKIDLMDLDDIVRCFGEVVAKIQTIDVLVNGSGICNEYRPEIPIGVNLLGLIKCNMVAIDLMGKAKNQEQAVIVNIASIAAFDVMEESPVYGATKAAVLAYTRAMAGKVNFSKHGITFICVCPGVTTTKFLNQFNNVTTNANYQAILDRFDLAKKQTPQDCAKHIVEAIELCKNGTTYMCDLGEMTEVNIPVLWQVTK